MGYFINPDRAISGCPFLGLQDFEGLHVVGSVAIAHVKVLYIFYPAWTYWRGYFFVRQSKCPAVDGFMNLSHIQRMKN